MSFLIMLLFVKKEYAGPFAREAVFDSSRAGIGSSAGNKAVMRQSLREVITYFSLPLRGPC